MFRYKLLNVILTFFTVITSTFAYAVNFDFDFGAFAYLKDTQVKYSESPVVVELPWGSSVSFEKNEPSTNLFPKSWDGTEYWPSVWINEGARRNIRLTDSVSGEFIDVEVSLYSFSFATALRNMNWGNGWSLPGCGYTAGPVYGNGGQFWYPKVNSIPSVCKLPSYQNLYMSDMGVSGNHGNMLYLRDMKFAAKLGKGRYYGGNYKGSFEMKIGPTSDPTVDIGLPVSGGTGNITDSTFITPTTTLTFNVSVNIDKVQLFEFLGTHLKIIDERNVWIHTGKAPDYLKGDIAYRFGSNARSITMKVDCSIKSGDKCAIKNEHDDSMLLDVVLSKPTNYELELTPDEDVIQFGEEVVLNAIESAPVYSYGTLKVQSQSGEANRTYNSYPGTSYKGQVSVTLDVN
ncbi:hypothetical protein [Vibrio owensii]|uniref:hypothetical protein n=1 Tax=Vibrio owensii TaxID=696485 RepID=UPI0028947D1D|nr:exported hypothetical protein [Vibrio owensii]